MLIYRTHVALLVLGTYALLFLAPHLGAQVSFEYDLAGNPVTRTNTGATAPPALQDLAPQYLGVDTNGLLALSVPVTGAGPFAYQWWFNGAAVGGATNDSLLLTNAAALNLGNYQLVARNSSGAVTSSIVNVSFFDPDGSGLPTAWELAYFGATGVNPNADPDGDGVSNYQEFLDGTDPTNPKSVMPRLYIADDVPGGTVSVVPLKPKYQLGDTVQITALPNPGWSFGGWTGTNAAPVGGSIGGPEASLTEVMNSTVALTPQFLCPVYAWGNGENGQTNVPSTLGPVVAVAGGYAFSLALQANGTVAAWGDNFHGEESMVPEGLSNVAAISAGYDHSLALLGDGTVAAWGDNTYGETTVPAGLSNVVAVAAGGEFSLALQGNGTVVAWGYNCCGQASVPAGLANVVAIAAGGYHSLALQGDGTVWAWGYNNAGQATVPSDLTNVVAIAAGGEFSMVLEGDGAVAAWGYNPPYESPVVAPYGNNVVAIAAGAEHWLALEDDGSVMAWGNNDYGQVSHQTTGGAPLLSNVVSVAAGGTHSLVAFNNGSPVIARQPFNGYAYGGTTVLLSVGVAGAPPLSYQWTLNGTNLAGATNATLTLPNVQPSSSGVYGWVASNALGTLASTGSVLTVSNSAPIFVTQPANQAAPFGSNTTFSVAAVGSWPLSYQWQCDGTNIPGATQATLSLTNVTAGTLGDYRVAVSNAFGTTWSSSAALAQVRSFVVDLNGLNDIPPGLGDVLAVAGGGDFELALLANGTVAEWGSVDYNRPNVPPGLTNVVAISAGYDHSLALLSNGTVAAWGYDEAGQIDVPPGLGNVVAISAGTEFSLALQANGTVVGWGADGYGQIDVPPELTNVAAIAAGEPCLALLNNGTVVAWGESYSGEAPVPAGLSNVAAIAASQYGNFLALLSNGTVVAWGDNTYGQTNVPAGLSNVVAVAAGSGFSLALRGNGTVAAWGYPEFATNSVLTSLSNVVVNVLGGLSNVVAISAGNYENLAIVTVGGAVASNALALGSGKFLANRQFQFTATGGIAGQGYALLASTNLLDWITLTSGVITNSPFLFSDPAAASYPRRFYRLAPP